MSKLQRTFVWTAWLALLTFGLFGLAQRVYVGREITAYGSYVPWGLWVSAYIYFVGLSAGAFLVSSLIYVFQIKAMAKEGRIALFVAAITLLMALVSIWFDLGHMWRFYEVFTRPNFHSMMAWMIWLYTAYFILILAELWFDMRCDLAALVRRRSPWSPLYRVLLFGWNCPGKTDAVQACHERDRRILRVLGSLGVPLAIAFHGGVGALFATLSARPYWHSSLFPILFLTGALVSGGALILMVTALLGDQDTPGYEPLLRLMGRLVIGLLAFDVVLEWSETSIPLWYGVGPEVDLISEVLFGRFWYVFWGAHILAGTLVPLVLLLWKPAERWATATAGFLIAATFLAVRLNLVIPGQVTPALQGLGDAYVDPRLSFQYIPSLYEWALVSFVTAAGIAMFFIGIRVLPLMTNGNEEVSAGATT